MHIRAELIDLRRLLDFVEAGEIVLPGFQRDYDWSPAAVKSLLTSMLLGWPSGTLMFTEYNAAAKEELNPRPFDGAERLADAPHYVVLDGQQRLTSLFHAVRGRGDYRYAIRWDLKIEGAGRDEIEDALLVIPTEKWLKDAQEPSYQVRERIIPISAMDSPASYFQWRSALEATGLMSDSSLEELTEFFRNVANRLAEYRYTVTVLDRSVPPVELAQIFEITNRTGLRLGTFDLMVARISTPAWSLRDAWDEARGASPDLAGWLGDDATPLLQAIALNTAADVRQSAVLRLQTEDIAPRWDESLGAMRRAIAFFRQRCGVATPAYLPYGAMLPAVAALFMREEGSRGTEESLRSWFFGTGFGLGYDVASNTRVVSDYGSLVSGSFEPRTVSLEGLLESTRRSQGAIWRTFLCSLLLNVQQSGSDSDLGRSDHPDGPLIPRSLFGRGWSSEPSAPHLRVLSFALTRRDLSAAAARGALLAHRDLAASQFLPSQMPSPTATPEEFEEFFVYRLQALLNFLGEWVQVRREAERLQ
ncbi:DUF262 domain-containing protein [Cellulomonas carbonis]|uniref:GmrSD restriction endonucleases N-terminal domain-containing protein n=1 Tax=Cellulomonas carbonis T26 TaxID=947969 RepID=A0A0A0BYF1_9CELL|nr:DUF262 domain-containing protein [Cellulomonas carbonis]KGM12692.1 hypothetical protein N868_07060 [Cellulomonas carbonis T26]